MYVFKEKHQNLLKDASEDSFEDDLDVRDVGEATPTDNDFQTPNEANILHSGNLANQDALGREMVEAALDTFTVQAGPIIPPNIDGTIPVYAFKDLGTKLLNVGTLINQGVDLLGEATDVGNFIPEPKTGHVCK